jgi:hypothetical protein
VSTRLRGAAGSEISLETTASALKIHEVTRLLGKRWILTSSQGSGKKTVKVTGRLSGNLSQIAMMQVFDSNDDHVLSKKEVSNVLQLLTGLDMNGDGRITAEEMSEEAIMTVAPRFADDKQRAMAKAAEMKKGTQGSAGAQRTP